MRSLHFPDDAAVSLRRDGVLIGAASGRDPFDAVVTLGTGVLGTWSTGERTHTSDAPRSHLHFPPA